MPLTLKGRLDLLVMCDCEVSMLDETQEAVTDWLATGEIGCSSKQLAMWLAFGKRTRDRWAHPHDPADFDRCLRLLKLAPGLRRLLPKMAEISPEWQAIVARWDDVEALHTSEVGIGWTKARSAPQTYALMRRIYEGLR